MDFNKEIKRIKLYPRHGRYSTGESIGNLHELSISFWENFENCKHNCFHLGKTLKFPSIDFCFPSEKTFRLETASIDCCFPSEKTLKIPSIDYCFPSEKTLKIPSIDFFFPSEKTFRLTSVDCCFPSEKNFRLTCIDCCFPSEKTLKFLSIDCCFPFEKTLKIPSIDCCFPFEKTFRLTSIDCCFSSEKTLKILSIDYCFPSEKTLLFLSIDCCFPSKKTLKFRSIDCCFPFEIFFKFAWIAVLLRKHLKYLEVPLLHRWSQGGNWCQFDQSGPRLYIIICKEQVSPSSEDWALKFSEICNALSVILVRHKFCLYVTRIYLKNYYFCSWLIEVVAAITKLPCPREI